jgi:LacI family transcriptional regulator
MRPTVHDIAEAAGVSLATVDRVLNRRPGVRAATRARVEEAIGRIGFVRDMAAANLAKSRSYSLIFIVPGGDNSFMVGLRAEIDEAIARSALERTRIRVIDVPPFDPARLALVLRELEKDPPSGLAIVAVDAPEVIAALDRLKELGTAVVTLVSDLAGPFRDHFAGIDNFAAGRTAGTLMGRFKRQSGGRIAVVAGSMLVRDHQDRLAGFRHSLREIDPMVEILDVMEGQDDPKKVHALVSRCLERENGLAGIYSLGAGNRGLIRALKEAGLGAGKPVVIAHELTPHTRQALQERLIDAVLNQDAGHEVRSAIRVMKAKADGLPVIEAQERIRIDIFLNDNLP